MGVGFARILGCRCVANDVGWLAFDGSGAESGETLAAVDERGISVAVAVMMNTRAPSAGGLKDAVMKGTRAMQCLARPTWLTYRA